jgi:signal transduction histidine kinase
LREELETIVTLASNDARTRKIKLTLEPPPGDQVVKADGEKLRQAFLNIVINALQATPAGGGVTITVNEITDNPIPPGGGGLGWGGSGPSTVELQIHPTPAVFHEIRFSDSGPGIEADARARVFEPFFTTKPDGTGLGLAITKKIIEAHNGTLEMESEVGNGTTVIVRLPSADSGGTP